jgi:hypothetical protein
MLRRDPIFRSYSSAPLVFACLCALVSCDRPVPAPRAQTVSRLKSVYYTMRLLQTENHQGIVDQLQAVTNMATLQNKWILLMTERAAHSGISSNAAFEQLCQDGYGRLFNVELQVNLTTRDATQSLTNSKLPVVVWSSGLNGVNELGFGDDITLSDAGQPENGHE